MGDNSDSNSDRNNSSTNKNGVDIKTPFLIGVGGGTASGKVSRNIIK